MSVIKKIDYETPIVKLEQYIEDTEIYVKREDLLPFSFGGNKVRIAQEYYADMDQKKKNCMIGYGNARSNLCRVLANMNSFRGGICYIISPSEADGSRIETTNSRIVNLCGANIRYCDKSKVSQTVEAVFEECKNKGLSPYYMYGNQYGKGNEAVPVRAYVKVYNEIQNQCIRLGVEFDYIFLATGTGMTQAGLIAGQQLNEGKEKIIGISVARKKEQEEEIVSEYIRAYFKSEDRPYILENINVIDTYLCGGYGNYGEKISQTIQSVLCKDGIPLDPTYTGKAFYGMIETIIKEKISGKVLFIHTGGMPLFFDNINILNKNGEM